jgi:hypothetical protein
MNELQRKLNTESVSITCASIHPGPVKTPGADGFLSAVPDFTGLVKNVLGPLFFKPPRTGALTVTFAAAGKAVAANKEKYKGSYFIPVGKLSKPSNSAQDERLAKELWTTTETICKELGLEGY